MLDHDWKSCENSSQNKKKTRKKKDGGSEARRNLLSFKIGPFPASFRVIFLFSVAFAVNKCSNKHFYDGSMSDVGSNCSVNCVTTTAQCKYMTQNK